VPLVQGSVLLLSCYQNRRVGGFFRPKYYREVRQRTTGMISIGEKSPLHSLAGVVEFDPYTKQL